MPCFTYITDLKPPTDEEVLELLKETQEVEPRIHVEQMSLFVPRWLRESIRRERFSVLYHTGGCEYQVLNVFGDQSKDAAIMYLIGYLSGHKKAIAGEEKGGEK